MNYIWHIVSIPDGWVEHEEKLFTYSKTDLEKYSKTKEYKLWTAAHLLMRGTFSSEELALNAIQEYGHDIHEYYYTWVVVEKHILNCIDGFSLNDDEIWFKWNDESKQYEQTSKPECMKHIIAFAQ